MYIYQIMSNNFGYIDIILLAMIAGFIILRLRNILGRKTGHQEKIFSDFNNKNFEKFKKNETNKPQQENKKELEGEERKKFLKGAEIAYESIITAFAKGDNKQLKTLLAPQMFSNFEEAINQRNKDNIKSELTFIGIKESKLQKYENIKTELFATVKFVSEIVSVKKDKTNKIIEGNPDIIKTVTDHWKFTKSVFNKNPNWHLSEIITQ
jgi:predicted lipid-binding transport protein (Tim44 family)